MAASDSNASGPQIDGFEIAERVGTGGFSSVYRATELRMGRDVAVKVLHTDFSTDADRRVFERECRALGLLARHPNIVTVYSATATTDGRACIVMELYAGTLRDQLDRGPVDPVAVLDLGVKMAGALQAAHDSGVLHRDIKPHNIFVSDYGEAALGDFGISSVDDERSISAASGLSVAYAAPEVLEDASASVASDVYSLAATLYHLADGSAPFASPQLRTTVKRILTEAPPGVSSSTSLPSGFDAVLLEALSKDPNDRPASARAFGEALRKVQVDNGLPMSPLVTMRSDPSSGSMQAGAPTQATGESTVARRGRSDADRGVPEREPAAPNTAVRSPARVTPTVDSAGTVDAAEHTVARPRVTDGVDVVVDEGVADQANPLRRRAAIGLAAAALVGVAGLGILSTRGDDSGVSVGTEPLIVDDDATVDGDVFFEFVDPPSDVRAAVLDDGTVQLSFDAVDGAVGYEAESRAPSPTVGEVRTAVVGDTELLLDTGLVADDAPCWVVRTIGEGRRSQNSPLVCVDR